MPVSHPVSHTTRTGVARSMPIESIVHEHFQFTDWSMTLIFCSGHLETPNPIQVYPSVTELER